MCIHNHTNNHYNEFVLLVYSKLSFKNKSGALRRCTCRIQKHRHNSGAGRLALQTDGSPTRPDAHVCLCVLLHVPL